MVDFQIDSINNQFQLIVFESNFDLNSFDYFYSNQNLITLVIFKTIGIKIDSNTIKTI